MFRRKTNKLESEMTKEELIKNWGDPNYIYMFANPSKEYWFYNDFKLELYFEDKKLITGEEIKNKVLFDGRVR